LRPLEEASFCKKLSGKNLKRKVPCTTAAHFHHAEALTEKVGNTLGTDLLWVPFANVNHLIASWKTGKARGIRQSTKIILFFLFFYLSMTVFCILGLSYAHLLLDYYNYAIKQ
jgi:hypothetical protein